ncbi:hypothetical protein KOW79_018516 [Hemibagrus wyckioides]|uniref:Chemokine interleukin-8-like domain-containing protein n=1 Tax=Hemibagrus wyckioides TaxID=337641 RepID=A0A9D3SAK1_9TELE|nr:eotaxin-like [Hemibagrus wyckioides]KAG7317481.1 hypothetical protein KOW79_018516 [Hemibagrus wyckioides]
MTTFKISTGRFLFLLILTAFIINTEAARCCFSYTQKPVRCGRLKGYSIQEITGNCDIRAIIFETQTGKFVCADPKRRWTQERLTCLRKKAAVMGNVAMLN